MGARSFALRLGSMLFRAIQLTTAIAVVGICSYFMAYLAGHNAALPTWIHLTEAIAGFTALYALIAFLLVCCLGGLAIFVVIGIVLDMVFACASVAIAYLTYSGDNNCDALPPGADGVVPGTANVDPDTARVACLMYRALFFLGLIAFVSFQLSAIFQFFIGRAHRIDKEKLADAEAPPKK